MKIYFIEANMAAGKTTLLTNLKNISDALFVEEPVAVWQNHYVENGENILDKYYQSMSEWAARFQTVVLITRFNTILDAIKTNKEIIVFERSLETDCHIFAKNLYNLGYIREMDWLIYMSLYTTYTNLLNDIIQDNCIEVNYILIRVSPEECFARMHKRNRMEESDVSIEYLQKLNDLHNSHYTKAIQVDGDNEQQLLTDVYEILYQHQYNA